MRTCSSPVMGTGTRSQSASLAGKSEAATVASSARGAAVSPRVVRLLRVGGRAESGAEGEGQDRAGIGAAVGNLQNIATPRRQRQTTALRVAAAGKRRYPIAHHILVAVPETNVDIQIGGHVGRLHVELALLRNRNRMPVGVAHRQDGSARVLAKRKLTERPKVSLGSKGSAEGVKLTVRVIGSTARALLPLSVTSTTYSPGPGRSTNRWCRRLRQGAIQSLRVRDCCSRCGR